MGRNKFEDQIKDKFGKREIAPSEGSWDKLSQQLNAEENRSTPVFWWIGIAATLVAGFFIAGFLYNQPETNTPQIVETPVEEVHTDDQSEPIEEQGMAVQEVVPDEVESKESPSAQRGKSKRIKKDNVSSTQLAERNTPKPSEKNNDDNQFAIADTENSPESIEKFEYLEAPVIEETMLAAEIENVLKRLAEKESQSGAISDSEVDSLLTMAASRITMKRNIEKSNGRIDATALLWDVEMEMEHSFREKVFEVLKEGYLKAKSAVANRNQ